MNTYSARDIYRYAKKCGDSQAKEAFLKEAKKMCGMGKLFIKELEIAIIEDILRKYNQPNIDHDVIELCKSIFNLDIKRDYLAQLYEQNLLNGHLNNRTRESLENFKKLDNGIITEFYLRDSNHGVLHEK